MARQEVLQPCLSHHNGRPLKMMVVTWLSVASVLLSDGGVLSSPNVDTLLL